LYEALLGFLARDGGADPAALHAYTDRLARADAENSYRTVEQLLGQLLARLAAAAAQGDPAMLRDPREGAVWRRLGRHVPAARWAELRTQIEQGFARTDALNLDRKATLLGAFFAIEAAAL
jgi:DNA polymerase-3 subunit delta'